MTSQSTPSGELLRKSQHPRIYQEGVSNLHELALAPSSCCSSGSTESRNNGVYLSGFRIVQDAILTRHCEYRLVLACSHRYERWFRFSQLKSLAHLPMTEATRQAWEAVRACKPPPGGRALCPKHLSRKCLAIERFLCLLFEDLPVESWRLLMVSHGGMVSPAGMPKSKRSKHNRLYENRAVALRRGAFLAPTLERPARTAGSQLRMR